MLSPPAGWHWLNLAHTIGLPVFAVLVMMIFELGLGTPDRRERVVKLGWDLCVLSLGAVGAVFSNPGLAAEFGPSLGSVQAFALLLIFAFAGGVLRIRRLTTPSIGISVQSPLPASGQPAQATGSAAVTGPTGRQAYFCLLMGAMALVVPAYLTARY